MSIAPGREVVCARLLGQEQLALRGAACISHLRPVFCGSIRRLSEGSGKFPPGRERLVFDCLARRGRGAAQVPAGFFSEELRGPSHALAFWAEFQASKLFGTDATGWRVRQMLALAAAAAAVFIVGERAASLFQLPQRVCVAVGSAVAAGAAFHPLMIDLISWPFMFPQLVWSVLTMMALYFLLPAGRSEADSRWNWAAALAGYLSLHVSGLGIATASAVAVVRACLLFLPSAHHGKTKRRGRDRGRSLALPLLLAGTAIHGGAMLFLLPRTARSAVHHLDLASLKVALGMVANLAWAGAASFGARSFSEANPWTIPYGWPYGLLCMVAAVLTPAIVFRQVCQNPNARNLTSFVLG